MLNFGLGEILVVLALALVVVGPDRLPEMVRFLGRQYGKLLRASNELRQAFVLEAERAESSRRSELLKARREEARARAEAAREQAREMARTRSANPPKADAPQNGETTPAEAVSTPDSEPTPPDASPEGTVGASSS